MKIELSHKKTPTGIHEFGIEFIASQNENYVRWVWYYLGAYLGPDFNVVKKKHLIIPYQVGKVVKKYRFVNNASRQAKTLSKAILKLI